MRERFRLQVRLAPARPSFKQMPETVPQYVQRLQTYLGDRDPLRVQAATIARIEKLLKGVPSSKMRKRPAPGKWSIAEILAHLADNELVRSYRIKSILGRQERRLRRTIRTAGRSRKTIPAATRKYRCVSYAY